MNQVRWPPALMLLGFGLAAICWFFMLFGVAKGGTLAFLQVVYSLGIGVGGIGIGIKLAMRGSGQ